MLYWQVSLAMARRFGNRQTLDITRSDCQEVWLDQRGVLCGGIFIIRDHVRQTSRYEHQNNARLFRLASLCPSLAKPYVQQRCERVGRCYKPKERFCSLRLITNKQGNLPIRILCGTK
jgi:hypothetical protein